MDLTDDCSVLTKFSYDPIKCVEGSEFNIKITSPIDLDIADKIFQFI